MHRINTMVLGLALMSGVAFAQSSGSQTSGTQDQNSTQSQMGKRHHGDGKADMQAHMDKLSTELNLTADQKTQISGIMKSQGEQMRAIRQDSSLTKEQKEAKMKEMHESSHSQINAVLTPDQQKKFAEFRKENREEHGEMGHHHDKDGTDKK